NASPCDQSDESGHAPGSVGTSVRVLTVPFAQKASTVGERSVRYVHVARLKSPGPVTMTPSDRRTPGSPLVDAECSVTCFGHAGSAGSLEEPDPQPALPNVSVVAKYATIFERMTSHHSNE